MTTVHLYTVDPRTGEKIACPSYEVADGALARVPRHAFNALSLSTDSVILGDGTLWSHAATLGTRTKDDEFTIDEGTVQNFVRVFATGYPQKVPVDYEHASTSMDPEVRRLRAKGEVPKAGDVKELRAVLSATDFAGDLKTAAEKLCQQAGRQLDDPRNLGLWMRWKPTAKALQRIQAGEMTELSITFDENWPDNVKGEGQGPTILAVALTNLPFLDDMLPVAASRTASPSDHGRSPAAPGAREERMTKITMLAALTALVAKPVESEEQGVTELSTLGTELQGLRQYASVVQAELGERDPVKAATQIRELKAAKQKAESEAAAARTAKLTTDVESALKKYESRLTGPLKELMGAQLRTELEAGAELAKTKTLAALESMPELGLFGRASGGDVGGDASADMDTRLDQVARGLLESDPQLKALSQKEWGAAYDQACDRAAKQIGYKSRQMELAR
jgi:hypothetical protein